MASHGEFTAATALRQAEPAGKTIGEIFSTYSASAVICERVIGGDRALKSPPRIGGGGGNKKHGGGGGLEEEEGEVTSRSSPSVSSFSRSGGGLVRAASLQFDDAEVAAAVRSDSSSCVYTAWAALHCVQVANG